jgi:serine protease Do
VTGDVILTVNGAEVTDPATLAFRIATLSVGDFAGLEVLSRGRVRTARLPLEAPPEVPARQVTQVQGTNPFAGAEVANLNPALADELGLPMMERGVIVLRVRRGTLAARMRVRPGDIILGIGNRDIEDLDELLRKLQLEDGDRRWAVRLKRDGRVLRAEVTL